MTSIRTSISWTTSTWNPVSGCSKVSEGCLHCYAEALFNRPGLGFKHTFGDVQVHPDRLGHVHRFKPIRGEDGRLSPHLVFVNSISDIFHEAIPDAFVHQVFDAMEEHPETGWQCLSKRPIRARKLLVERYKGRGLPEHIWAGFSVEDSRVAGRLDILRSIKDRIGSMVAFVSVEPIIGPTDKIDFTGIDWSIHGGESGHHARIMDPAWMLDSIQGAQRAGSAIFVKQHGQIRSNPLLHHAPAHLGITAKFRWLVDNQVELLGGEKGGATLEGGVTWREFPPAYHRMKERLNGGSLI